MWEAAKNKQMDGGVGRVEIWDTVDMEDNVLVQPEGDKGVRPAEISGKSNPGRESSQCKECVLGKNWKISTKL